MTRFARAGIYLVTSQSLSAGRTTVQILEAALSAGIRLVQIREKDLSSRDLTALARRAREMTAAAGALLIVNDRLDVALAVGADGVHLGQEDLPVADARRIAPDLVIGASSHSVEEALRAEAAGASYVNIGPLFPTRTKAHEGGCLGLAGLREIAPRLRVPFTVMGGIRKEHIPDLAAAGARTIAVVTAITAAADPRGAAEELLETLRDALRRGARPNDV
jgi:thiamine-phosphate pyrophosphorylase